MGEARRSKIIRLLFAYWLRCRLLGYEYGRRVVQEVV